MFHATDDVRIQGLRPLLPPAILMEEIPESEKASTTVYEARRTIADCLGGRDRRLVAVVGPCSIHDVAAALDYATRLKALADRLADDLVVVMRVYFEKPRTTVGWKGLINDPDRDGSFAINKGLRLARGLLRDLAELGLPAGCEFLDTITPQFLADLVSWGAIGARTTESQVHRELASGLSMSVGFKNGTSGDVQVAIDSIQAAARPHSFLSVTKQGLSAIVETRGNDSCHLVRGGGSGGPNHRAASVRAAADRLERSGLPPFLMIDCSHGNSGKDAGRQPAVAADLCEQVRSGVAAIAGVMVESHLNAGRQDCRPGQALDYGVSITDACLAWNDTVPLLEGLAAAARQRAKR